MESAQCDPAVNVFVGMSDNTLRFREHNEPGTGRNNWTSNSAIGGPGWTGKILAGPQGAVYHINSSGVLYRYKYIEGTGWEPINGGVAESIDTGWQGWNAAGNRNRLTVDAANHFYVIMPNGDLQHRVFDNVAKTWTRVVIDTGWGKFDQVFASGAGVLYARNPSVGNGTLYRFHYDAQSQTWLQRDLHIATGWAGFKQLTSPGGDVIYALNSAGNITWYRYLPAEQTWAHNDDGQWKATITSWTNVDEIAPAADGCALADIGATAQCQPRADIFHTKTDKNFAVYYHNEPETGLGNADAGGNAGYNWDGRIMAGPTGYKYLLRATGDLTRQRWTGTGWANGGVGDHLATGWTGYSDPATRFRVTVDTNNHFYLVLADGRLARRVYDEVAATWSEEIIDQGWGRYNHILAAGDGVLFARDPNVHNGGLFRFHYDWQNRRWIEYGRHIGSGWKDFKQITSAGAGTVYALTSTGVVAWYRYDHEAGTFQPGARGAVRENITTLTGVVEIAPAIDTCALVNPVTVQPQAPGAPDNERGGMVLNPATGLLEIAYVSDDGVLLRGVQSSQGTEVIVTQGMAGYGSYTGTAGLNFRADGRLVVVGQGQDSQIRAHTQNAVGGSAFSLPVGVQGAMLSSPVLERGAGNLLTAFAVDDAGRLWYSTQLSADGPLGPWRAATTAVPSSMSPDFSVLRSGEAYEVVYRRTDGTVAVARFQNGALDAARHAGGLVTDSRPTGVVFADGKVQVVARGAADDLIATQREGAAGFPGWQTIGGVTAAGAPDALLNQHGIIEIVTRSADGFAYRGGQTAPGASTWRVWETGYDAAATDPVIVAAGNENRYFHRDDNGNGYLTYALPYTSDPVAAMAAGPAAKQVKEVELRVAEVRTDG